MMQGFVGSELLQAGRGGSTWWVWLLIILLLVALIVWFMSLSRGREDEVEAAPVVEAAAKPEAAVKSVAAAEPVTADDLTKIEGIGPKISGLMKDSGVPTFAAMAETSEERLKEILKGADFRALANPTTWPEQAKLAAKGDWDALQKLQDELDGGRRA
jgi:predicted flap endonuclease-1-like 5' DNA nuclease